MFFSVLQQTTAEIHDMNDERYEPLITFAVNKC